MDKSTGKAKRTLRTRKDMKLGEIAKRHADARTRKVVKQDITKEQFLAKLGKVCQPISKEPAKPDSGTSGT